MVDVKQVADAADLCDGGHPRNGIHRGTNLM